MDISLLSTIDANYWVPFEILASSLLRAKDPSTVVKWHVMSTAIGADWDAWRAKMETRHREHKATFILHRLDGLADQALPLHGRARSIMYDRLLAPEQLAALTSRVLYLDADMIALGPIEELWSTDLDSQPCGCVQDIAIPTVSSGMAIRDHGGLSLDPESAYFNAGVLLIDIPRWKEQGVGAKALAYLASHFEAVNLFDQEALNVALGSSWHRISYRWNLIASVAGRSFLDTAKLRQDDYAASLLQPCIVHYAGTLKPWLNSFLRGRWYDLYRAALKQALPMHRPSPTLKHLAHAAYDASIRRWTYPLERKLWQTLRGF